MVPTSIDQSPLLLLWWSIHPPPKKRFTTAVSCSIMFAFAAVLLHLDRSIYSSRVSRVRVRVRVGLQCWGVASIEEYTKTAV